MSMGQFLKDAEAAALADEDAIDEAASAWTAYDGQVKTGQEEADQLTKRFGPWYYVIDKALFANCTRVQLSPHRPLSPYVAPHGAWALAKLRNRRTGGLTSRADNQPE